MRGRDRGMQMGWMGWVLMASLDDTLHKQNCALGMLYSS